MIAKERGGRAFKGAVCQRHVRYARVHEAVEAGRLSLRRAASLLGLSIHAFADLCRSYGRALSYDA